MNRPTEPIDADATLRDLRDWLAKDSGRSVTLKYVPTEGAICVQLIRPEGNPGELYAANAAQGLAEALYHCANAANIREAIKRDEHGS